MSDWDKTISNRMMECLKEAERLLEERDKEQGGYGSHFSYENTQIAVALFNAEWGKAVKRCD